MFLSEFENRNWRIENEEGETVSFSYEDLRSASDIELRRLLHLAEVAKQFYQPISGCERTVEELCELIHLLKSELFNRCFEELIG